MIIYTNQRSKKRKQPKTKALTKAQSEHRAFLARHGIDSSSGKRMPKGNREYFSDLSVVAKCTEMSNEIPGSGFKRSIDDHKWKRGREEKPEVIQAVEEKRNRVSPYANKGAYMYVTDDADAASLGRKV